LGLEIARYANQPLGWIQVKEFSDGETSVEISENIRGMDVFLIQSTCSPANQHLMQLLLMADACKRASAKSISAVIPYFGYSRQDRRPRNSRGPVSAKLVADLIEKSGISRVITIDLHADQIEGFFSIPVDNIYSSQVLLSDIWKNKYQDLVIVSPDVGGVLRARAIARRLDNAGLAIIDKRREEANKSEVMNIIGDVDGKTTIIFDDMVDTAGTLCNAAAALKNKGSIKTVAYAAHPVLSGPAIDRIIKSELDELVVTDTIPLTEEAINSGKIRQLSVAELIGETVNRIVGDESVSSLYAD
jgi:ribose-phosphate pyrophosphokinase